MCMQTGPNGQGRLALLGLGALMMAFSAVAADLAWTGGDATLGDGKVTILCNESRAARLVRQAWPGDRMTT